MQIRSSTESFYNRLGGELPLRTLVRQFYQYMDTLDIVRPIRGMHAPSLKISEEKLFMFLSGWMGGPSLYIEKYGHPRLRRRHLPFAIDASARDQWMHCMRLALADVSKDKALNDELAQALFEVADFMRNTPEPMA